MGWSSQVVVARLVIIEGTADGLFVYNGTPGPGTLIASEAAVAGTDQYGNPFVQGIASYLPGSGEIAQVFGGRFAAYNETYPANSPALFGVAQASGTGQASEVTSGGQGNEGVLTLASGGGGPGTATFAGAAGTNVVVDGTASLQKQATAPVTTPAGCGTLYADAAGGLYYLSPSGTSTKLASG